MTHRYRNRVVFHSDGRVERLLTIPIITEPDFDVSKLSSGYSYKDGYLTIKLCNCSTTSLMNHGCRCGGN